jgi:hypothetical protein
MGLGLESPPSYWAAFSSWLQRGWPSHPFDATVRLLVSVCSAEPGTPRQMSSVEDAGRNWPR